MTNKISQDQIKDLAKLASLDLTQKEIEALSQDMEAILEFVDQLKKAEVDDYPPTEQVSGLTNVVESDQIESDEAQPEELLAIGAKIQANQFKVPKVL